MADPARGAGVEVGQPAAQDAALVGERELAASRSAVTAMSRASDDAHRLAGPVPTRKA